VILRLLTGEPQAQAQTALQWVMTAKAGQVHLVISDLVVSEVYFALQHHFHVSKAEALHHLSRFLAGGEIKAEGVVAGILATPGLATAKPGFVDRLIHEHYLRNRADGMVTFEKAARSLPDVEILS
jgi:predicted nucleic-acid-binding protein